MSDKFDRFIDTLKSAIDDGRCGDRAVIDAVKAVSDEDVEPIELFVGARCVCRNGKLTTIGDGDDAIDGYDFVDGRGVSYMADGSFYESRTMDVDDIVRILNPEDRPVSSKAPFNNDDTVELFVGARCLDRAGNEVNIIANDGVGCNEDTKTYPFKARSTFKTGHWKNRSYCADGRYISGAANSTPEDIIRILNPNDRPKPAPPMKYRSVNKSDIDKEVETLYDGNWIKSQLKAFYKSSIPGFQPDEVIETIGIEGQWSGEWWVSSDSDVRIIARDDDKVMKTVYINIYDSMLGAVHTSRPEADGGAGDSAGRIACLKIEYYDGQYDE